MICFIKSLPKWETVRPLVVGKWKMLSGDSVYGFSLVETRINPG